MARPRKSPSDKRDRKIVVWVTAAEQARFLVNATRVGMTGPDYVRTVSCGGDLQAADAVDHPARLVLAPTRLELATLMARAGAVGLPLDAYLVRVGLADAGSVAPASSSFELVDALVRNGTTLQRLIEIAETTGIIPEEVRDIAEKIERVLDRLLP